MKLILAIGALTLITSEMALGDDQVPQHPAGWHCITDHFSEALVLNQTRKPLYAAISGGATGEISDALMDFERSLTASTKPLLPVLEHYWRHDVPLLCREFTPIAETPAFSGTFSIEVPTGEVRFVEPLALMARLEKAYVLGGHEKTAAIGREEITKLDKADTFQCLTKHFLESIVRTAEVRDEVSSLSQAAGLGSTHYATRSAIESQIVALRTTSKIDRMAEAVHRQGINILCGDVPPILK